MENSTVRKRESLKEKANLKMLPRPPSQKSHYLSGRKLQSHPRLTAIVDHYFMAAFSPFWQKISINIKHFKKTRGTQFGKHLTKRTANGSRETGRSLMKKVEQGQKQMHTKHLSGLGNTTNPNPVVLARKRY